MNFLDHKIKSSFPVSDIKSRLLFKQEEHTEYIPRNQSRKYVGFIETIQSSFCELLTHYLIKVESLSAQPYLGILHSGKNPNAPLFIVV